MKQLSCDEFLAMHHQSFSQEGLTMAIRLDLTITAYTLSHKGTLEDP